MNDDLMHVMEAATERLSDVVLLLFARFTSEDPDSPGLTRKDLSMHVLNLLPNAVAKLESERKITLPKEGW